MQEELGTVEIPPDALALLADAAASGAGVPDE